MNKLVVALSCLVLVACTEPAESTAASSNPNVSVEKLLTVDGCTVYRFQDGGHSRYFSKCHDAHSEVTYQQNCGKNCSRPETISSN
jgi:outer membrane biogenesis lipoprotein LolB